MDSVVGQSRVPAIVVGGGINALGIVRSLGAEDIPVVVVERTPGGPACESKYATPALYGPLVSGAKDDFVGYIVQVARRYTTAPVLFLTQEAVVQDVSLQRERLAGHVKHVLASHQVLSSLMDKSAFQIRAQQLGFPVPRAVVLNDATEVEKAKSLTFPCVLKPIAKNETWEHRFKKAYRFENFEGLAAAFKELSSASVPVIVQEWIEGADSDVYFTLVYRDGSGLTLASFTGRKLRQWPPLVGGTASCMPAPEMHAQLESLTTRFFDAVGFVGTGSMEFKRDTRTGKFLMVEPTVGRTDYQEEVATLNGVNIPLVAYCASSGILMPTNPKSVQPARIWRDSEADEKSKAMTSEKLQLEPHSLSIVDALYRREDPRPWLKELRRRGARKLRSLGHVSTFLTELQEGFTLPAAAKTARAQDRQGLASTDPGSEAVVDAGIDWLCQAQDLSSTKDGGFARDYSLISGWAASYPETSGYIIPTLIEASRRRHSAELTDRARRCLDWLVSIQFPEGGFQGGVIGQTPRVPVTFNTGQILLGLAAGAAHIDRSRYLEPMRRAAQWLVDTQDADGCWRRFSTPFAEPGEKTYETHVSWGLFEAARVLPGSGFGESGLRQVEWALSNQQPNGWFRSNCLEDPARPLTHTIGYALRGIVEAHKWSGEKHLLDAARKTADSICSVVDNAGFLAGRLDQDWRGQTSWCCLTGNSQIAHSLFLLAQLLENREYAQTARRLTSYVRRTVTLNAVPGLYGGIRGSFPIDGDYGRFQYLNWACKFTIDALWQEEQYAAYSQRSVGKALKT